MAADYQRILSDLKKRIFHPVYLFHGEEPYYIDLLSDAIEEQVLSEMEKEFNQSILYGRDVDANAIMDYAKRYPMMASHQVVIVKEAQEIRNLDDLSKYINNPLNSTILVICYKYKKIDKRKQLYKLIDKHGIAYESAKLYENKIPAWINGHVEEKGYSLTPKASAMITDYLGTNLQKIHNELSKLYINVPAGSKITESHVEKYIGISKDYNIFELQHALSNRDIIKANRIILYFAANPKENSFTGCIFQLFAFFSKVLLLNSLVGKSDQEIASALSVHPFFLSNFRTAAKNYSNGKLANIISLLREYDLKNKGLDSASTEDGDLLKELIYKILH